jgi:hypothetical protein
MTIHSTTDMFDSEIEQPFDNRDNMSIFDDPPSLLSKNDETGFQNMDQTTFRQPLE